MVTSYSLFFITISLTMSMSTAASSCIGTCYSDFRMLGKHLDTIEKDTSLAYCWQSTILIHCLSKCNGKQDMRMDKTRCGMTDDPALHIGWAQCTVNNERYIADHCNQQVGLIEANSNAGNDVKTCSWLHDYHACYIANIELYCGFDLGQYLRTHEHLVALYIYRPFVEMMKVHRVDMHAVNKCDTMYIAQQILAGQEVVTRTTSTTSTTTTTTTISTTTVTTTTSKPVTEAVQTTKKLVTSKMSQFVSGDKASPMAPTAEKNAVHVLDQRETKSEQVKANDSSHVSAFILTQMILVTAMFYFNIL